MRQHIIVLGPKDLKNLMAEADSTTSTTHRIQIEFEIDESKPDVILDTVKYYPVDKDFKKIESVRGEISARGCPYPPDCTISLKALQLLGKEFDPNDFKDCIQRINDKSSIAGLKG